MRKGKATSPSWIWMGAAAVAGALLTRWQLARLFTEQPRYELEARVGPVEIRRYAARWVAETRVEGSWERALHEGFRRLASYIFGSNHRGQVHSRGTERLAMTSPVNVRRTEHVTSAVETADSYGNHIVSFNMPSGRARDCLPRPDDERVKLTLKPEARVAVLRYRGGYDGDHVASKFIELLVALRRANLRHKGQLQFAGYDPPSTLPLLRRNEVWIELEPV
jgi:hypothetical protein